MNQETIHVFAKWRTKDGQLQAVLNLLGEVVKKSVEEQGNLYYKVHQSKADQNTLLVYEGYVDEEALTTHRVSAYFQDLVMKKITPLLEDKEVILSKQLVLGLPGVSPQRCLPIL